MSGPVPKLEERLAEKLNPEPNQPWEDTRQQPIGLATPESNQMSLRINP